MDHRVAADVWVVINCRLAAVGKMDVGFLLMKTMENVGPLASLVGTHWLKNLVVAPLIHALVVVVGALAAAAGVVVIILVVLWNKLDKRFDELKAEIQELRAALVVNTSIPTTKTTNCLGEKQDFIGSEKKLPQPNRKRSS